MSMRAPVPGLYLTGIHWGELLKLTLINFSRAKATGKTVEPRRIDVDTKQEKMREIMWKLKENGPIRNWHHTHKLSRNVLTVMLMNCVNVTK